MTGLKPGKIGFFLDRRNRHLAPSADGLVGAIHVVSVGKLRLKDHRVPLFPDVACGARVPPIVGERMFTFAQCSLTGTTCCEVASRLGLNVSISSAT